MGSTVQSLSLQLVFPDRGFASRQSLLSMGEAYRSVAKYQKVNTKGALVYYLWQGSLTEGEGSVQFISLYLTSLDKPLFICKYYTPLLQNQHP